MENPLQLHLLLVAVRIDRINEHGIDCCWSGAATKQLGFPLFLQQS
jgi:hypothetical protein